jgi:hypothetical protein
LIGGGPVEVHPSAAGPGPRPAWPGRRRGRCGLRGRFLKED